MEFTLKVTEETAKQLWHTSTTSFLGDQPERFCFPEGDMWPDGSKLIVSEVDDADTKGTLYWTDTALEARILLQWFHDQTGKAFVLYDTSEDYNGYVVWAAHCFKSGKAH
jgi:hypothetical protein